MPILTLIPNARHMGVMVLTVLILGSFYIARHLHLRWLSSYLSFVASNALVKSVITLSGLLIIPMNTLFQYDLYHESIGIAVGVILGCLTTHIETRLLRQLNRDAIHQKTRQSDNMDHARLRNAKIQKKLSLSTGKSSAKGLQTIRQRHNQFSQSLDFTQYSLSAVILVAVAEECLFRGYWHTLSGLFTHTSMTIIFLITGTFAFAFSHVSTHWTECTNKLPLSCLSMISMILTGTLSSAIIMHVIVNLHAWRQMQQWRASRPSMSMGVAV